MTDEDFPGVAYGPDETPAEYQQFWKCPDCGAQDRVAMTVEDGSWRQMVGHIPGCPALVTGERAFKAYYSEQRRCRTASAR